MQQYNVFYCVSLYMYCLQTIASYQQTKLIFTLNNKKSKKKNLCALWFRLIKTCNIQYYIIFSLLVYILFFWSSRMEQNKNLYMDQWSYRRLSLWNSLQDSYPSFSGETLLYKKIYFRARALVEILMSSTHDIHSFKTLKKMKNIFLIYNWPTSILCFQTNYKHWKLTKISCFIAVMSTL